MFGMVDNNVESVKFIGRREMKMNANMKSLFYESDKYRHKPYFNDAKDLFRIWFCAHFREQLIINRNKYEWETLDTPKIKIVFYSHSWEPNDYGTKVRIKCHQRIQRKEITIDGELCQNWELLDSFAVRLEFDGSINHTDGYKKFYDNPRRTGYWEMKGNGFR